MNINEVYYMQFSIRFDINVIRMYIMNSKNSKAIEDLFEFVVLQTRFQKHFSIFW